MKTHLDCIPCLVRQALDAARIVTDDASIHEQILRETLRLTAGMDLDRSPPLMGQLIHRRLRQMSGIADPYQAAKRHFNQLVLDALPALSASIEEAPDPLLAAVKLSIAANTIDLGVVGSIADDEVTRVLAEASKKPLCGDWPGFRSAVAEAEDILFLADNAGEIVVDRLLVELLGPEHVTVAVRGGPVINDATLADARDVGLTGLVEVIENGSDAPGTILTDCSPRFRERFRRAGLVIAKGQGNFETLSGLEPDVFFLFKVKCPFVARHVGLPLGAHALLGPGASDLGVPGGSR